MNEILVNVRISASSWIYYLEEADKTPEKGVTAENQHIVLSRSRCKKKHSFGMQRYESVIDIEQSAKAENNGPYH